MPNPCAEFPRSRPDENREKTRAEKIAQLQRHARRHARAVVPTAPAVDPLEAISREIRRPPRRVAVRTAGIGSTIVAHVHDEVAMVRTRLWVAFFVVVTLTAMFKALV